jgi:predicted component of type VI protein secretion system
MIFLMIKITVRLKDRVLDTYHLDRSQIVIGRERECDVFLDNPAVSRHNTRIVQQDGKFWVEDCQSANGTILNDKPVQRAPLKEGDRITVGKFALEVSFPETKKDFAFDIEGTMQFKAPVMGQAPPKQKEARPQEATHPPPRAATPPPAPRKDVLPYFLTFMAGLLCGLVLGLLLSKLG